MLYAFVFFSPFTTWLALSTWLRLPVVLILITSFWYCYRLSFLAILKPARLFKDREDLLLCAFIAITLVSWALGYGASRSLNHLMALSFTLVFYFITFKLLARETGFDSRKIAKVVAYSALTCCSSVIVEFLLLNIFDFRLRQVFLTGGPGTSNMDFFVRGIFKSVAGTAEEPGSMALFLNIFCPIGLWHFQQACRPRLFRLLLCAYGISLLMLTSVAGIAICLVFTVLIASMKLPAFLRVLRRAALPLLMAAGLMAVFVGPKVAPYLGPVTRDLVVKLTLNQKSQSASIRTHTWNIAFLNWADAPLFGKGPGYGVESLGSGYHSLFLTVLADLGIIELLVICAFLGIIVLKLFFLPSETAVFFFIPYLGSLVHFNIIGDYFHAPFWICIALIQMIYSEMRTRLHESPA